MMRENDIALLELETRANMSSTTVSKIQIRQISNSTVDQLIVTDDSTQCIMAGWGYTTYEGESFQVNKFISLRNYLKRM